MIECGGRVGTKRNKQEVASCIASRTLIQRSGGLKFVLHHHMHFDISYDDSEYLAVVYDRFQLFSDYLVQHGFLDGRNLKNEVALLINSFLQGLAFIVEQDRRHNKIGEGIGLVISNGSAFLSDFGQLSPVPRADPGSLKSLMQSVGDICLDYKRDFVDFGTYLSGIFKRCHGNTAMPNDLSYLVYNFSHLGSLSKEEALHYKNYPLLKSEGYRLEFLKQAYILMWSKGGEKPNCRTRDLQARGMTSVFDKSMMALKTELNSDFVPVQNRTDLPAQVQAQAQALVMVGDPSFVGWRTCIHHEDLVDVYDSAVMMGTNFQPQSPSDFIRYLRMCLDHLKSKSQMLNDNREALCIEMELMWPMYLHMIHFTLYKENLLHRLPAYHR